MFIVSKSITPVETKYVLTVWIVKLLLPSKLAKVFEVIENFEFGIVCVGHEW